MHIPDAQKAQIVEFDRYVINIPLKLPARAPNTKRRGTMNMTELLERAEEVGMDTAAGRSYHTEFHKRLVLPVGCLFLSLLGMPLGLQAGPGRRAIGVPFGLILYITYYIMFTMSRNMANSGTFPPSLVMWVPNILFAVIAAVFIHRVAHEKPLLPSFMQRILEQIAASFTYVFNRLSSMMQRDKEGATATDDQETGQITLIKANAKTRIFHFPECDYYHSSSCTVEFKDSDVALKAGFDPCMFCKTILADKQTQEQQREP